MAFSRLLYCYSSCYTAHRAARREREEEEQEMKPIATVHEDTLVLYMLELGGIVPKKKINQARKIVRGFSDYRKLTGATTATAKRARKGAKK